LTGKGVPIENRDLDENTLIDLGVDGKLCSMTIEHSQERVGIPEIEYEKISAY